MPPGDFKRKEKGGRSHQPRDRSGKLIFLPPWFLAEGPDRLCLQKLSRTFALRREGLSSVNGRKKKLNEDQRIPLKATFKGGGLIRI